MAAEHIVNGFWCSVRPRTFLWSLMCFICSKCMCMSAPAGLYCLLHFFSPLCVDHRVNAFFVLLGLSSVLICDNILAMQITSMPGGPPLRFFVLFPIFFLFFVFWLFSSTVCPPTKHLVNAFCFLLGVFRSSRYPTRKIVALNLAWAGSIGKKDVLRRPAAATSVRT
jgi:hypothetical protein